MVSLEDDDDTLARAPLRVTVHGRGEAALEAARQWFARLVGLDVERVSARWEDDGEITFSVVVPAVEVVSVTLELRIGEEGL